MSKRNTTCGSCGKTFTVAGSLKKHIYTIHEGHKDHKCNTCGKSFSRAYDLKTHIHKIHEGHKHTINRVHDGVKSNALQGLIVHNIGDKPNDHLQKTFHSNNLESQIDTVPKTDIKDNSELKLNVPKIPVWTKIHNEVLNDCLENRSRTDNELDPLLIIAKICKSWRDSFFSQSSITDEILFQKVQEALFGH